MAYDLTYTGPTRQTDSTVPSYPSHDSTTRDDGIIYPYHATNNSNLYPSSPSTQALNDSLRATQTPASPPPYNFTTEELKTPVLDPMRGDLNDISNFDLDSSASAHTGMRGQHHGPEQLNATGNTGPVSYDLRDSHRANTSNVHNGIAHNENIYNGPVYNYSQPDAQRVGARADGQSLAIAEHRNSASCTSTTSDPAMPDDDAGIYQVPQGSAYNYDHAFNGLQFNTHASASPYRFRRTNLTIPSDDVDLLSIGKETYVCRLIEAIRTPTYLPAPVSFGHKANAKPLTAAMTD